MRVRIRNLISRRRTRPTLWSGSRTTSRRPSAISRRGVSRCQVKYSISAAVLLPLNIISLPQSNHQPFSDKPSSRRIHICIIHQKLEKKRFPTFAPPLPEGKREKKRKKFQTFPLYSKYFLAGDSLNYPCSSLEPETRQCKPLFIQH